MTEKILEENGLENFYIARSMTGKLKIEEKCGVNKIIIHSIPLPSKLTSKTRKYVIELLNRFFDRYKYDIQKLVKEYKKFNSKWSTVNIRDLEQIAYFYDDKFRYNYKNDKQFFSTTVYQSFELEELEKFVKDKNRHDEAFEAYKKIEKFKEDDKKLSELFQNINACKI
jgi:hypothetical protein